MFREFTMLYNKEPFLDSKRYRGTNVNTLLYATPHFLWPWISRNLEEDVSLFQPWIPLHHRRRGVFKRTNGLYRSIISIWGQWSSLWGWDASELIWIHGVKLYIPVLDCKTISKPCTDAPWNWAATQDTLQEGHVWLEAFLPKIHSLGENRSLKQK